MSDNMIYVLGLTLDVLITVIMVKLAFKWLVRFGVLNRDHPGVQRAEEKISAIFEPIYRPIRRVIPEVYGIDLSPIVVILIMVFLRQGLRYLVG